MEKGRSWLPSNGWLASQVVDNVNINNTCNAFWNGSVNFYRSGGGCRNTGELQGVFVHEWGHGLDANDGGGYDNPSEAYADIVAFLEARESCVGRGFFVNGNCSGYGDACLDCSASATRTGASTSASSRHADQLPAEPLRRGRRALRPRRPLRGLRLRRGGLGPRRARPARGGTRSGERLAADGEAVLPLASRLGRQRLQLRPPQSDGCAAGSWYHKFACGRQRRQPDERDSARRRDLRRVRAPRDRLRLRLGPVEPGQLDLPAAGPARPERRPQRRRRAPLLERRRRDLPLPRPPQRPGCARGRRSSPTSPRRRRPTPTPPSRPAGRSTTACRPSPPTAPARARVRVRRGHDGRPRGADRAGPRELRLRGSVRVSVLDGNARRVGDGPDLVRDRARAEILTLARPRPARASTPARSPRPPARRCTATGCSRSPPATRSRPSTPTPTTARAAAASRAGPARWATVRRRRSAGPPRRDHRPRGDDRLGDGRAVRQHRSWGPWVPPAGDRDRHAGDHGARVTLTGLTPCTVYYYSSARPTRPQRRRRRRGGLYHRFLTLGTSAAGSRSAAPDR